MSKRTGADHIARQNGQILPPKEGKFLVGGVKITRAEILPEKGQGVVEGIAPNGSWLQVNVPMGMLKSAFLS